MRKLKLHLTLAVVALAATLSFVHIARASNDSKLDEDIRTLAESWADAKYLSKTDSERKEKMDKVGSQADGLVTRYPGRVEPLIWDGIVTSERASLTWGFTALNLATKARDILDFCRKARSEGARRRRPNKPGRALLSCSGVPCRLGRYREGSALSGGSG